MRFLIGIVLALSAVIGVWLFTLQTPPTELATAEQPSTTLAESQRKDDDSVQDQVEAAVEAKTEAATQASALESALVRYPSVSIQEIESIFSKDPKLIGIRPDFLLALMERGDIAPNEVVLSNPEMGPLTAAMFVVANARQSFTVAHFDRLVGMGADINGGETWRTVMAMESNPEVLDKWYAHASLGPETHEELYNKALGFGNVALRDYLLNEKGGAMEDLRIEPMGRAMATGMVRGIVESFNELDDLISANSEVNSEVARAEVIHFLSIRSRQTQMLKALTDDDKELQELDELEQKLVAKINELEQGSN